MVFTRSLGFEVAQQICSNPEGCILVWRSPGQGSGYGKRMQMQRILKSLLEIPFEKLGTVTGGEIIIDNDSWGTIEEWNEKYDNAIGNYFKNYMPE